MGGNRNGSYSFECCVLETMFIGAEIVGLIFNVLTI